MLDPNNATRPPDLTTSSGWIQASIDGLKANVALLPLIAVVGGIGITYADQRYDARYVQSAALNDAVTTIQLGQNEQQIITLDTQIQIAHRRLSTVDPNSAAAAEIQDEIRVLEAAKDAAIRQRSRIARGLD